MALGKESPDQIVPQEPGTASDQCAHDDLQPWDVKDGQVMGNLNGVKLSRSTRHGNGLQCLSKWLAGH